MVDYKKPLKIVLSGHDLDVPLTNLLNEASVKASLEPSLDFLELVESCGFTRRGRFAWSAPTVDNGAAIASFLKTYAKEFLPLTMVSLNEHYAEDVPTHAALYPYGVHVQTALSSNSNFLRLLNEEVADFSMRAVDDKVSNALKNARNEWNSHGARWGVNAANKRKDIAAKFSTLGGVSVEYKNGVVWVRVFPHQSIAILADTIHMPKTRHVRYSHEKYMTPRELCKLTKKWSNEFGEDILDSRSDDVVAIFSKADKAVTVGYQANEPGTVYISVGDEVDMTPRHAMYKYRGKTTKTALSTALDFSKKYSKKIDFFIHPALNDVVNMQNAEKYEGDERLFDYQKEAVGLHLSTSLGYLQSCSPGMGKTVIQLAAMREKSKKVENYRALVVCEAVVRPQWVEEAAVWFPEAVVYAVGSAKETDELAEALSSTEPVVIICSYAQLLLAYEERDRREAQDLRLKMMGMLERITFLREEPVAPLSVGSLLLDIRWEDICADEAVVLRNGTSKQANIMWTLRKNSKVATALTATPINREADDIARLISWVRNDRTMFTGKSLSDMYDLETEAGAKKLAKSFGPLVFRRDISEVKAEMPSVVQKVELLDPSPAEKALASAAEKELKRCYMELVTALEEVEKTDNADKEQLKKVKTQLKEANGAWLGGTQLARMAVSDPTALLSSTSVGAALLRGQGLIEAAMQDEPTKRKKFIEAAQKYVAEGKQILVFTDFIDVAEALVEALVENGFNAKAYTGKNGAVRDRARKEFQDGTLDIMVCTKVAERGLTLHKAAVLYHYDLPWTLEKIIQRTGRSIRIGSENETVTIVFMVMKGTVEQRMATQLVTAGMTASLVMDKSRGVDVSKTETASAMSGLMTTMAGKSDNKNLQKFGKMLLGV